MQSAGEQVMDVPVADVPMEGGKKRRSSKNNKKGGAIEVGSVLGPAILYGLRRSFKPKKQRGGDAFSSQASPVGESTGPLLAVVPVVAPAGSAVVPPSVDMVPKEAVAVPTDSGDASLAGGAKKGKKGKKGPMAEGRVAVYGKVKAWGGDNDDNDKDNQQDGGKKKVRRNKKGGDKQDNKNDNNQQDGGKKKQRRSKKGGDKQDDKQNDKQDNKNDNNQQDGGKKKQRRTKKVKGGALDLYAQQLEQISLSLNELLFK